MNANPLAAFIYDAAAAGTVKHEIVKKDIDCIIAEVDRDGMYMCICVCVDSLMCIHTPLSALKHQFPFPSLYVTNFVAPHREQKFLHGKICLFRGDSFTMWVAREHRLELAKCMVQRARAVTENSNAPCIVRKEVPISIKDACKLLKKCGIAIFTVMQYGQKADFGNKVVKWALNNVRVIVCVCFSITDRCSLPL